jgi:hypothetical protein
MMTAVFFFLLSVMNGAVTAGATTERASPGLADEIKTIINRNQASLDSVYSIHARVVSESTVSFVGKGSRTTRKTEEIWYDGSHVRVDVLDSGFTGENVSPLLLREEPGGVTTVFAPPPVGHTEIESVESRLLYVPDTKTVTILPPEWDERSIRRSHAFLNYQLVSGSPLKRVVLACAERSQFFTVKSERIDGDDCFLLECEFPQPQIVQRIWVCPSKGHCIKKTQLLQRGTVFDEYTVTLKEYSPGLWWFDSATATTRGGPNEGDSPETTVDVSLHSAMLNEPIDSKVFTLAGTNIPPGARVRDTIANLRYVYGAGYRASQEDVDLALDAMARADAPESLRGAPVPDAPSDSNEAPKVDQHALDSVVGGSSDGRAGQSRLAISVAAVLATAGIVLFIMFRRGRNLCR